MEAGRGLDALVAIEVMGRHPDDLDRPYPPYSTDIAAAWEVVEKLSAEWSFTLARDTKDWWDAEFYADTFAKAPTAAHAICLSALNAVGTKEVVLH